MLINAKQAPLVVVVADEGWGAYTLRYPPTERDSYLFSLLVSTGGVNEEVAPGVYLFNAELLANNSMVLSLESIRLVT
jgi:hypothetical protein